MQMIIRSILMAGVKIKSIYENDVQGFLDMSDGAPALLQSMNKELKKLGPDYESILVGAALGASDGEDSYMGPPAWRDDPQKAKGSVCATVLKNGDYNIVITL